MPLNAPTHPLSPRRFHLTTISRAFTTRQAQVGRTSSRKPIDHRTLAPADGTPSRTSGDPLARVANEVVAHSSHSRGPHEHRDHGAPRHVSAAARMQGWTPGADAALAVANSGTRRGSLPTHEHECRARPLGPAPGRAAGSGDERTRPVPAPFTR